MTTHPPRTATLATLLVVTLLALNLPLLPGLAAARPLADALALPAPSRA
ncbi:MAG: hypothetical protein KGM17_10765 [Sphingomonadales bacterium]|nr:hypothetical protein [Sphingomonadales bacterium]